MYTTIWLIWVITMTYVLAMGLRLSWCNYRDYKRKCIEKENTIIYLRDKLNQIKKSLYNS